MLRLSALSAQTIQDTHGLQCAVRHRYSCLQCYHTHASLPRVLLKELSRYFLSPPHWYDRVVSASLDERRQPGAIDGESRPDVEY